MHVSMKEKPELTLLEWLNTFSCPRTFIKSVGEKPKTKQKKKQKPAESFEAVQVQRTDDDMRVQNTRTEVASNLVSVNSLPLIPYLSPFSSL